MLDMNIALIGAPGTGKTTFMQKALGLADTTPPTQCHRKWTIENIPYMVRFVELKIDDVHVKPGNVIEWPKAADDAAPPRIDGAITMYDVTVKESLAGVPEMMSQCSRGAWKRRVANAVCRHTGQGTHPLRSCRQQMRPAPRASRS